jgi:hypothetical protein
VILRRPGGMALIFNNLIALLLARRKQRRGGGHAPIHPTSFRFSWRRLMRERESGERREQVSRSRRRNGMTALGRMDVRLEVEVIGPLRPREAFLAFGSQCGRS